MSLGPPPPGYRDALRAYKAGDLRRAITLLDRVRKARPEDIRVRTLGAMLDARQGRLDESERAFKAVIADCPSEQIAFGIRHQLALLHLQQRRLDDALAQIDLALAAAPDTPVLISARADMLLTAGRRDEADALLRPALEAADPPSLPLATTYARLHARTDERDRAIALLERALPDNPPPTMDARRAIHQLGALYEHAQRFDEAFDCYARAGALSPVKYDARAAASLVDRIIADWTAGAIADAPRSHNTSHAPVFIVGMPRSGTSLTEQILASHPNVEGVGES
ncbi:MAG: tetratricopeptide repeat protein, partial [Phycisphaerales bacterium JB059]